MELLLLLTWHSLSVKTEMEIFIMEFVFVFIIIWIPVAWYLMFRLDNKRIRSYFTGQGNQIISITWRIFGKGWISESSKEGGGNRIYEVEYKDKYGNIRHVWCKTAALAGVFLSDEKIIKHSEIYGRPMTADEKVILLEEEIRRLKSGIN